MDEVNAADRMDDIPVSDAEKLKDSRENPPPRLLVIVGEPFGEEHMPAITHKIAAGLSPSIGNFSTFLGDTFVLFARATLCHLLISLHCLQCAGLHPGNNHL